MIEKVGGCVRMDPDRRVLSSRSPATKYEVLLVEDSGKKKGLSQQRLVTCFNVLDELIPELGVYRKLVKMLRDELYEAVYSQEYTSAPTKAKKGKNSKTFIQRIPNFVLLNRVYEERDQRADQLQGEINKLKENIAEKEASLEECHKNIEQLKKLLRESNDAIYNLELEIENCSLEKKKLDAGIQYEQLMQQSAKERYEKRLAALRDELSKTKDRANFLVKYKEGYDNLEEAFNDSSLFSKKPHTPAVMTRRAQIIHEIASAKVLEEQLLTMENAVIEEYEVYIEEHKPKAEGADLESTQNKSPITSDGESEQKMENDRHAVEERFKQTIADIKNEMQLIEIQRSGLEDQLHHMEAQAANKEKTEGSEKLQESFFQPTPGKEPKKPSKIEDDDEEIDFVKIMSSANQPDPFIPHERIMSKYSAMMYYSCNQGKNYHEFKDAKFCASCGETTLLCPHKVAVEKIVSLPHNCTHIKITRPTVHLLEKPSHHISATPESLRTQSAGTPGGLSYGDESIVKAQQHLTTTYKFLWDNFISRTSIQRRIPRLLSEGRLISIINQFYAMLTWQDDYALEEEQIVSVLDTLFTFFHDRYLVPDVTYLAVHDFITSAVTFAQTNKSIQLFAQAMCGNLDPVVIRYVLLVNAVKDVRTFAKVVYPFMNEEDIEQFTMGYTSFSENKISKNLLAEYYLYIILKYREPRFQDTEVKLLQHPGRRPGFMTDIEFAEAIDNISPLASERLRRRLFAESVEHCQSPDESVPVMRLSQITGYLTLLQLSTVIKETVAKRVGDSRHTNVEGASTPPDINQSGSVSGFHFPTTTSVGVVAGENAKRSTTRQLQRIENYQYD